MSTSHGHNFVTGWLILCKCRQYHFVSQPLTWHEAARYCRTQYTGLAVTEDMNEMTQLKKKVSSAGYKSAVWINLYTHIHYKNYYREDNFIKEDQKIEMAPFFVRFFCRSISLNAFQSFEVLQREFHRTNSDMEQRRAVIVAQWNSSMG